MALFLTFTPSQSAPVTPVETGPLEFFSSIDVARWELIRRGQKQEGSRALVADADSYTWRERHRVAEQVHYPTAREGKGGWVALVWWRRAGEKPPQVTDPAGELWMSVEGGKVERIRLNSGEWDTGKAQNAANTRRPVTA